MAEVVDAWEVHSPNTPVPSLNIAAGSFLAGGPELEVQKET